MPATRLRLVVTAFVAVAGSILPVSPPVSAPAAAAAGPASVTLEGRGYGHGRGMSQYGAQEAAAEHGRSYRQIVRFYYPGLELGVAPARGRIRVLLSSDTTDDVVVRHQRTLYARRVSDGRGWELDRAGAKLWKLTPANGGADTRLSVLTDRWRSVRVIAGEAELAADIGVAVLVTPNGRVGYDGMLRSSINDEGGRDTVNHLRLEDYLRGVVPLEVPALWHPQAVQAQAVAARTYAAYYRSHPKADHYDLCDTTSCQVYGGLVRDGRQVSHPASDAAIRATSREVLRFKGEPAFTEFSSSNGGWTVAGDFPYQVAKQDPWDPVNRWPEPAVIRATSIENAFPGIGDFQRLRILERDGHGAWNGRVLKVRVVGARRAVVRTGDEFRSIFGLRSTWFRKV